MADSSSKSSDKLSLFEARIINNLSCNLSIIGFSTLTLVDVMYKTKLPIEAIQYLCILDSLIRKDTSE